MFAISEMTLRRRLPLVLGMVAAAEAFHSVPRLSRFATARCSPLQGVSSRQVHEEQEAKVREGGSPFTMADQKARIAKARKEEDKRVLDVDSFFDPSYYEGKRVLVIGGNRGLGRAIADTAKSAGATTIVTTRSKDEDTEQAGFAQVISGIDVTKTDAVTKLAEALDGPIDVLVNNAGYFPRELEEMHNMNFDEQIKTIDICAVGPLRIVSTLVNNDLLTDGSTVGLITSQGGSVTWRFTQNPEGKDYGHHMSKAAANMAGVLLAQELNAKGVTVVNLHPGFNKTKMTEKYKDSWDEEGAVDPSIGAKRVLYELSLVDKTKSGSFINCEDGGLIPY